MGNKLDLVGKKFNRLLVLSENPIRNKHGQVFFNCLCDCGKKTVTSGNSLKYGYSTSCGCLSRENTSNRTKKHGMSRIGSVEYNSYKSMIQRCFNKKLKCYADYGGRGITVCDRWIGSFSNFIQDMGLIPSKSHSLDRIDVNGDYEPSNCRWATRYEQNRNKRSTVYIEHNGIVKLQVDWSKELNISVGVIKERLKKGQSFSEIYNTFINTEKYKRRSLHK